jgi:hypothetical protein
VFRRRPTQFGGRILNKVTKVTGRGLPNQRAKLNKVTKVTGGGGARGWPAVVGAKGRGRKGERHAGIMA